MSDDRLTIQVNATVPAGRVEDEVTRVRHELVELGIVRDVQLDEAETKLRAAMAESLELRDAVLLQGTPPVPGVDGRIEWCGDFLKEGFVVDPRTDAVDYRRKVANPSVEQGQLLAQIIPPVEGTPGIDVMGKNIDPRKPRTAKIKPGLNVQFSEGNGQFFALKSGRVRFVKETLSVDDVFEIEGSVGLKTGHINHPGAVIVNQDVDPESELIAAGDIEVRGSVEEAFVQSEGSVMVRGGIVGKERCRVVAAGNIEANFIQNAEIEAGGDVIVGHEAHQCKIRARGTVLVKGRIVGGETSAIEGIDAQQIGTEACVRTVLSVGKDWVVEAKIKERKVSIDTAHDNLKKVKNAVAPLQNRLAQLQGKAKEQATLLIGKAKEMEEAVEAARRELEDLYDQMKEGRHKIIVIRKIIYPDSVFHVGPLFTIVENTVEGSRRVEFRDGKIRLHKLADDNKGA